MASARSPWRMRRMWVCDIASGKERSAVENVGGKEDGCVCGVSEAKELVH